MADPPSTESLIKAYRDSVETGEPRPEQLPWYVSEVQDVPAVTTELFEKYSKVPHDRVREHIKKCRDNAFKVFPYPCLGRYAFLETAIVESPQYPELLERVKNGDKYLEIGCCVGQDIRKVIADGAPSENCYGSDLSQEFMDIGYDLFLDRDTLKSKFIAADILNPNAELQQLNGTIDIVHAASFFHLFSWDESVTAMKNVVKLLKAQPGSLLVGRQIGNVEPSKLTGNLETEVKRWRHNEESFKTMWKQVSDETGSKWDVQARLSEVELREVGDGSGLNLSFIPPGSRWFYFTVRRL